MTEKLRGRSYLKDRVRLRTKPFLAFGALSILWVTLGLPTSIWSLARLDFPTWIMRAFPLLLSVLAMVVDALPGERAKARLVFWRLQNPLPGSRAFDKENLDDDQRIDKDRLREAVGGSFPRAPAEQNKLWYQLYRSVENDTRVQGIHAEYLMLRDLAWFSLVLIVAALLSLVLGGRHPLGVLGLAGFFAVSYFLFRRAAYERGHRFVNTVLAVISSRPKGTAAKK